MQMRSVLGLVECCWAKAMSKESGKWSGKQDDASRRVVLAFGKITSTCDLNA